MTYTEKTRSNWWFLLPLFFGVIGGVIAFFILRHDDPKKARNCLYLGIAFMMLGIMLNVVALSVTEIDPRDGIHLNKPFSINQGIDFRYF